MKQTDNKKKMSLLGFEPITSNFKRHTLSNHATNQDITNRSCVPVDEPMFHLP